MQTDILKAGGAGQLLESLRGKRGRRVADLDTRSRVVPSPFARIRVDLRAGRFPHLMRFEKLSGMTPAVRGGGAATPGIRARIY